MDDAAKGIARELKEEAKEVTLEAAEVIALALTMGFVGMALGALLFILAIV